tara:strand:- start:659 stop:1327 length:669 start_codon:yes stop_codon:yes gene_type:complete
LNFDRTVTIVDYGAGNLRSVARAVAHAGYEPFVTSESRAINDAWALIVPGVGAAADTMDNLRTRHLDVPIHNYIDSGRPFLGICMGMQALFEFSEEGGQHECLGILSGRVARFPSELTVPHIGWNTVHVDGDHPVFKDIPPDAYFYFVHSYHAETEDQKIVIGTTDYETRTFPSVVGRENIIATQFHPEKSGANGLKLYANFIQLARERGSIAPDSDETRKI